MSKFNGLAANFASRFESLVDLSKLKTSMNEICRYALFPPGKCFRAGLTLLVARALSTEGEGDQLEEKVLSFATALEVLHAASLIHDDLPALDDDSLRRGRPSVHRQFGEAGAILAGDTLLVLASEILTKQALNELQGSNHSEPLILRHFALASLLQSSAIDICEGQLLDIQSARQGRAVGEGSAPNLELLSPAQELELRHQLKTGSLIRAAVLAPSLFLSPVQQRELQPALEQFSRSLGILFQITDDLLEATSNAEILGKNVDSDTKKGTPTYVSVHGLAAAQKIASETAAAAKSAVLAQPKLIELADVVDLVLNRKS